MAAAEQTDPNSTGPQVLPGVAEYRQILIWPLALHIELDSLGSPARAASAETPMATARTFVDGEARRIDANPSSPWKRIPDPLFHLPAELGEPEAPHLRQEPYAEFVYFHDFVQRFLYPTESEHMSGRSALHVYRRTDIERVRIHDDANERIFELRVDRCNLYLFRMGVAALVLEVTNEGTDTAVSLPDVVWLEDRFRRVYAPFFGWNTKTGRYDPGFVPSSVEWVGGNGAPVKPASIPFGIEQALDQLRSRKGSRDAPIFLHWNDLLGGALETSRTRTDDSSHWWRHIVDERMPFLAYVRLADDAVIDTIPTEVWSRLCFADPSFGPGDFTKFAYSKAFMKNFEAENCYDRFLEHGTRYMFAGFSFVMVANGISKDSSFSRDVLRNHFRHMYFQMALIAHLEFATYLAFSSHLSGTTQRAAAGDGFRSGEFQKRLLTIHEEFIQFVHVFRFTGISNQMQAQEMFDHWRKHLRLDAMLRDVREELETATAYHFASLSSSHSQAANRLNTIAVVGLAAALTFSFLGMNLIWDGDTVKAFFDGNLREGIRRALIGLTVVSVLWTATIFLTKYAYERLLQGDLREKGPKEGINRAARRSYILLGATGVISMTGWVLGRVAGWW